MQKKRSQVKYRLTCNGPAQLTEYNQDWNKNIVDSCLRNKENLFVPHPGECQGCKMLEIKKLN